MNLLKKKIPILVAVAAVLVVSALFNIFSNNVQKTNSVRKENGKIEIVATTTMLGDLANIICGDSADVTTLMGPGIDPHLYQASAGDVTALQNADVVLYNGLHLEGKMGDVFAALEKQAMHVVCVENGLDKTKLLEDEENPDIYDPHVWFDVALWKRATEYFTESMGEAYPENKEIYDENLKAYLLELDELDSYIRGRIFEIGEESRVLVTAHDAFRYFGRAYGVEVKGLQGISTDAEAGTADMSELASFITERKIKAIFVESSVPPKTIEALCAAVKANGFKTQIGGELYSDSLGDAASGDDNYIETCKANVDTITEALK